MKKILSILLTVALLFAVVPMAFSASAADTEVLFTLGADGAAGHKDGSTAQTTYSETVDGYTLNITGGAKMYPASIDGVGNGCIKFGTGSVAGSMSFTVPSDVTSVVLYVGKYKTNTSKITVNGASYTLSGASNSGAYDEIVVDTTTEKTVTFTTVSGGYRCMLNSIKFVIPAAEGECEHEYAETGRVDATCEAAGEITETCSKCGEGRTSVIPALGHSYSETERVESTCETEGYVTETCATCGGTKTTELELADCTFVDGVCTVCGAEEPNEIVFEMGADGDASHADGSSKTEYTETVGSYTLSITNAVKMATGARDAKGNGCIRFGTSGAAGSFSFTVPGNVARVIIYVAQYKANAAKISVNGTEYTITTASNNGEYTPIEVDTTSNKTVSFETVTGGLRVMINTITWIVAEETGDADCEHAEMTEEITTEATCTNPGVITKTCSSCGYVDYEDIPQLDHTFVEGKCSVCNWAPEGARDAILGVGTVDGLSTKYTVLEIVDANGNQGKQYADEIWKLNTGLTLHTVQSHLVTEGQIRIYASADHDGYVEFISANAIDSLTLKLGNKVDTLNVYGKVSEESEYQLIGTIAVTSTSYNDYTFDVEGTQYKYIKLDVAGSNQIRMSEFTVVTVDPVVAACDHGDDKVKTPAHDEDFHWEVCECTAIVNKVVHDFTNGDCACGQPTYTVDAKDYNLTYEYEGVTYYFNGVVADGKGGLTTNAAEAAIVKIETNGTGYRFYIMDGETKMYLVVGSGGFSLSLSETPCRFTFNTEYNAYLAESGRGITFSYYTNTETSEVSINMVTYDPTRDGFYAMLFTEVVTACEHTYDNACDADCNLCGEVREVGDHVYGDWVVDIEATTNKAGSKHRECSECGAKETEVIPMVFGFRGASLELQSSLGIIYTINADLVKVYGYTNIY
ncbi:MAG: hypothetical protein IJA44_03180, partial [Clostridia bacterium]|nr:hypothetical protein [Clostridia bacterium]